MTEPNADGFSFTEHTDKGPVDVTGATQVGCFAVAPSFRNDGTHVVAHWPTGWAVCICEDFEHAMKVVDDVSRNCAAVLDALEQDKPHHDASLECDDPEGAKPLIGKMLFNWILSMSEPIKDNGRTVGLMVRNEKFKTYRKWRTG